jgi:hypothetical protein
MVVSMGTAALLAVLGLSSPATAAPPNSAMIVVLKNQDHTGQFAALNASREGAVHADQSAVLDAVRAQGGTNVRQLISVNAIAANLSPGAIASLRANPAVASIQPDARVAFLGTPQAAAGAAPVSPMICPADPAKPMLEPEALTVTHTDQAWQVATGKDVTVAIDGMNDLAGNPNLIRADGSHVVVGSPTPDADNGNDESFGDASVVAAQGTVTYDYSKELPFSGLPAGCTFQVKGLAPDASLVDADGQDFFNEQSPDQGSALESQVIAGIDNAVVNLHANVLSQSFGFSEPGGVNLLYQADDAAVAAGVTVAASSGDSGSSGTMILPAADPNVIAVGATDTLRLRAQADGYADWASSNMAALSSGGPAANDKVVDLVAPGDSSAVACNPAAKDSGCPTNTLTETFRGTSMSAPIVAGAAADVIQAYAQSHEGTTPTPALVKQILTGTATDLGAPADQQGAGLLDTDAAVRAAQQEPGSSVPAANAASLVSSPSQVDITGHGGTSSTTDVALYNTGNRPTTVTGRFRELSQPAQFGPTVTEKITAPAPGTPIPLQGNPAAAPITFTVPGGLAQFNADLIIPDPKNNTDVGVTLFDPKGRLAQVSYSYNADFAGAGPSPNDQHTEIQSPMAGTWTAKFFWNANDVPLQAPPSAPGSYRGNMSFHVTGQHDVFGPSTAPVTIPAHGSATVPLHVAFPAAPGDHPESVQFTGSTGAHTSLPVSRRTLIASTGGAFTTAITSTVGRDIGQLSTYDVDVPPGEKDLDVAFHTADASADNTYTYYLVDPNGNVVVQDTTPNTTAQGIGAKNEAGDAYLSVANPVDGRWEVDVQLDLTVSGKEFSQTVSGTLALNQAQVADYGTLPTSSTTKIGKSTPIDVRVTNTTTVGRTFTLVPSGKDITGGAVATGVYLAPGVSGLLTANLVPTASAGTVVSGTLAVSCVTSAASELPPGRSDPSTVESIAALPYAYTAG